MNVKSKPRKECETHKVKLHKVRATCTQAGNLRVHIKTVHEGHSDFECDSCDKAHKCDSCENPSLKVVI